MGYKWCEHHFTCFHCFTSLADGKSRYMECDAKPFCRRCFEKLPSATRTHVKKYTEREKKLLAIKQLSIYSKFTACQIIQIQVYLIIINKFLINTSGYRLPLNFSAGNWQGTTKSFKCSIRYASISLVESTLKICFHARYRCPNFLS